jgi:hypothetical protein
MTAKTDNATWEWFRSHFPDDADVVALTTIAGMWACSNRVAEALHLEVEPPGKRIAFQEADRAAARTSGMSQENRR